MIGIAAQKTPIPIVSLAYEQDGLRIFKNVHTDESP